jgi:hypothetical protein
MLKELITKKIDEIFAEYQEANNIPNGNIDLWEAQRLDDIEEALAELINRVCPIPKKELNTEDFTPSWYIYTDAEGIAHSETYSRLSIDQFLTKVSKRIAFDDLDDITVQKIYFKGKELVYVGWQPGMKFEYTDLEGNSIWIGYFEEWDH